MGVHWVAQRDPRTLGKPSRGVVGRISAEQEHPLILCRVINIVLVGAAGRQTTEPAPPPGEKIRIRFFLHEMRKKFCGINIVRPYQLRSGSHGKIGSLGEEGGQTVNDGPPLCLVSGRHLVVVVSLS